MKNLKIRSFAGLCLALLVLFNVSLVVVAVVKNNDLYIAYAILVSCALFYLYEKFKISRIFFECDIDGSTHYLDYNSTGEKGSKYCQINPN